MTSQLGEDCRMSFVRFVFLIPWTTFVACVRMKHYTLRVTAPSPTWDSRQQLIVSLSKFKTNINMIRTYIVFSILRHVINSPVDNIFGRAVCGRSYNPTFGIFALVVLYDLPEHAERSPDSRE